MLKLAHGHSSFGTADESEIIKRLTPLPTITRFHDEVSIPLTTTSCSAPPPPLHLRKLRNRSSILFITCLTFYTALIFTRTQANSDTVMHDPHVGLPILATSMIQQEKSEYSLPPPYECARWVPAPKRNVLFVNALGMKSYASNALPKYMSGEFYYVASWDYAIRQNGFSVDEISWADFELMPVDYLNEKYHRIILGCVYSHWEEKCNPKDDTDKLMALANRLKPIRCKVGALYMWDHKDDEVPGFFGTDFFTPKQVLTIFDENDSNTFLGMFPHFVIDRETLPPAERDRVGMVLGKDGQYFDTDALKVIEALAQHNFTIHTTCKSGNCKALRTIEGVINHKLLKPRQYAKLLSECAFMLGIGNPIISPSPIIGLANGVAFLNPHRWGQYQHPPLVKVGEPYVYNIENFGNITDVVRKAEAAVRNRFASHIPSDFQVEKVVNRACAMMMSDNICSV